MGKTLKLIKDPIYGSILLSNLEHEILKSDLVNRLHQIVQMSSVFFVYPSGKHSRFSHSIGVMYLASKALRFAFANAKEKDVVDFLSFFKEYICNILKNQEFHAQETEYSSLVGKRILELESNEDSWESLEKLFVEKYLGRSFAEVYSPPSYIMGNFSLRFAYYVFLQFLRLKGLFHDVGHLPFSHIFEFALDKGKLHELLGKRIAPLVIIERLKNFQESVDDGVIFGLLYSLFNKVEESDYDRVLMDAVSSILSSNVDVDRIDYVLRDGLNTGFLKDSCDYERIVKTFVFSRSKDGSNKYLFYPSVQALNDIRELLYDRFRLYKSVVNHHKVKKMDAILEIILRILFNKDCGEKEESFKIICKVLKLEKASGNYLRFIVSQLTDDWLLTMLKRKYFDLLERQNRTEDEEKLLNLLSEFFTFSSRYKSFWKREKDYVESLSLIIESKLSDFEKKISNLWNVLCELLEKIGKREEALKEFEVMKLSLTGQFSELISKLQFLLYKGYVLFQRIASRNSSLEYLIIPSSLRSIGIENFELIDLNTREVVKFGDSTSLGKQLLMDFGSSIRFFVYYYVKNEDENEEKEKVLRKISNVLLQFLDEYYTYLRQLDGDELIKKRRFRDGF